MINPLKNIVIYMHATLNYFIDKQAIIVGLDGG